MQDCANRFRAFCLEHNLLEFSLQMEVFIKHLWKLPACRDHLVGRYRHLIAENVEEDNAAAQDILREWLPRFESALVIYDSDAGYRRFLGADPDNGYTLRAACDAARRTDRLVRQFAERLRARQRTWTRARSVRRRPRPAIRFAALALRRQRYYPEMLNSVADEIRRLVQDENVPPGEIVVLAPFLLRCAAFLADAAARRHPDALASPLARAARRTRRPLPADAGAVGAP